MHILASESTIAHPSPADLAIAAKATTIMAQAQQELLEAQTENRAVEQNTRPQDSLAIPQDNTPSGLEKLNQTSSHACDPTCQLHGANRGLTAQQAPTIAASRLVMTVAQVYQQPPRLHSLFSATA